MAVLKSLVVVVFLGAVAGLEFWHEHSRDDIAGGAVCLAPQSQQDVMTEALRLHLHSH